MSKKIDKKLATDMQKIVNDLKFINRYGRFPPKKGYKFSRYKNAGLVRMGKKTTKTGAKVMDKPKVTKKGKTFVKNFR